MPRAYDNEWQGDAKRVLCVCSANMLRSPTMQVVLSSDPFNYNTRSCGTHDFALIQITADLLGWADEIVCADSEHFNRIHDFVDKLPYLKDKVIVNLRIPDIYGYRDPQLVQLIGERYQEWLDNNVQ